MRWRSLGLAGGVFAAYYAARPLAGDVAGWWFLVEAALGWLAVWLAVAASLVSPRGLVARAEAEAVAASGLLYLGLLVGSALVLGGSFSAAVKYPLEGLVVYLPLELGPYAAASLASWGLGAAGSVLGVAAVTSPALGARLSLGMVAGVLAPLVASAVVVAVFSRRWPLPGLLYGLLVGSSRLVSPLYPRVPAAAVGVVTVGLAVLLLAWRRGLEPGLRLQWRGLMRSPGLPLGLVVVAAVAAAVVAGVERGYFLAAVATGSMRPALEPGDLVLVAPLGPGGPEPGEIIAYVARDGSIVVHRVVGVGEGVVYTKGDANPAPDPPVPRWAVLGRVVARIPMLGKPYLFLASRLGSAAVPLAMTGVLALAAAVAAFLEARRAGRVAEEYTWTT